MLRCGVLLLSCRPTPASELLQLTVAWWVVLEQPVRQLQVCVGAQAAAVGLRPWLGGCLVWLCVLFDTRGRRNASASNGCLMHAAPA